MHSIMDSHLADVEYSVDVPELCTGDAKVRIEISAVGGGTVGKSYAWNMWMYNVIYDGQLVITGDDLGSNGTPATHAEMAVSLAGFLSATAESEREMAGVCWQAREFLELEGERLGVWNADVREAEAA